MANALGFMKQVAYRFKMRYGLPAYVYEVASHSSNPESGAKSTVLGVRFISKCCILSQSEARKFVYDLAFISANKDFTTGGFFDPQDRQVFIDADDLPDYVPQVGDFIYCQQKMYMVKDVDDTLGFIYRLTAKRIKGGPIVHAANAHSALLLEGTASNSLQDRLTRSVSSVLVLTQTLTEVPDKDVSYVVAQSLGLTQTLDYVLTGA
jgi:hypothetical protein